MYKNLIVAFDGSDNAIRATEEAVKIAKTQDACHITIVLVAEFRKAKTEVLHATDRESLTVERRKKMIPAVDIVQENNISYTTEILNGDPGPTIIEFANKSDFDMLIIGSRGLNRFQEMVLGSVSHKVVKRVNCPVLVVK